MLPARRRSRLLLSASCAFPPALWAISSGLAQLLVYPLPRRWASNSHSDRAIFPEPGPLIMLTKPCRLLDLEGASIFVLAIFLYRACHFSFSGSRFCF